jgi:ABC-2 type transport system permease protein
VTDAWIVAKKELREIVGGGGGRRGLFRELIFIGLFGIFFPLSQADAWRAGIVPVAFFLLIPVFITGPYVADSFAGERERKTLETLLATRLPDAAIYLGKVSAVCLYAWVTVFLILATSLAALNLTGAGADVTALPPGWPAPESGGLFVYAAPVWVAWGLGSMATALLMAGVGTLVSLKAATVRAAHQTMMLPLFVLVFGVAFGLPWVYGRLSPSSKEALERELIGLSPTAAVLVVVAAIGLVAAVFLAVGLRRFRRGRLIAG